MKRSCVLVDLGLVDYGEAWELQKRLVAERLEDAVSDILLLAEHIPTYTVGRRGSADGLEKLGLPVYEVERGGDVTYHGPGQLVGYPILSLPRGKLDVRAYVTDLEEVLMRTAADFDVEGGKGPHAGLWVGSRKLASIGVAIKHYVTYHGFALNVNPDLSPFRRIRPCGLEGASITSLEEILHRPLVMEEVKTSLTRHFSKVFGVDMLPSGKVARKDISLSGPTVSSA
ncbi:MAG: lipoyl(octanoyl) transferase LipB [Thermoplasmata archaeon]